MILALPLLLVIGSKGALIFTVLVTSALVALPYLRGNAPLWSYMAVLACYATVGIITGIRMQDYHVIGFVGGVLGLMSNPIGRGIGVGGNLAVDATTIDWARSQQLGHVDPVVESAIGVMFYQMGVFAIIPLAILVWLALKLWGLYMALPRSAVCDRRLRGPHCDGQRHLPGRSAVFPTGPRPRRGIGRIAARPRLSAPCRTRPPLRDCESP